MHLKSLEISGFKSFGKKVSLNFNTQISSIVGPNGSGKSNIAESFRFVLGEQSIKSMRGKRGEDLIFNGTNGLPKQNRASVKVSFDNTDKRLPIDYDEVTIERIVHRDGANEYLINNSQVRLKDVSELLASANIGSTGHHIISQGEADRILNTSIKERREMLEDALGLRVFQYKKIESQKKLEKTNENISQVESLRREIAPHIKFLKKQVEKFEEAKALKEKLKEVYREYLKKESVYLAQEKNNLDLQINQPKNELAAVENQITKLTQEANSNVRNVLVEEIKKTELDLSSINAEKSDMVRRVGRLEGEIESLRRLLDRQKVRNADEIISISKNDLERLRAEIAVADYHNLDLENLRHLYQRVINLINTFVHERVKDEDDGQNIESEIKKLNQDFEKINFQIIELTEKENKTKEHLNNLRKKLDEDKNSSIEAERQIIALMREKNELQNKISEFAIRADVLDRDEKAFKQELTEGAVLVGREILDYEKIDLGNEYDVFDRAKQIDSKKQLERMKIKVEEMGVAGGEEVLKEYNETTERDLFLMREIEDLHKSVVLLEQLIVDLDNQINTKFKEGIEKINTEFQKFFELMFGGGTASLKVVKVNKPKKSDLEINLDEDAPVEIPEDSEEGIDINVNLPRKKIKGLMMLSGGERALTSIALLFAISQVNPPPFIILDETDAALDEANSRKYGDMIENLSKYSQLILITHNRETMSRAGALYGVTMINGLSQLLTIAFEEGAQWAK